MIKQLLQVKDFQRTFEGGYADTPRHILPNTSLLRHKLMEEENQEYLQATSEQDLVGIADALGDMLYVLCGTILEHGMPNVIEDVFDEIHRSNMSKADENGKPIVNGENGVHDKTRPLGKVLKSKNYYRPDLAPIIEAALTRGREIKIIELLREKDMLKEMNRATSDFSLAVKYGRRLSEIDEQIEKLRK